MRQSVRKAYFSYFGRAFSIEKRRLLRTGYPQKSTPCQQMLPQKWHANVTKYCTFTRIDTPTWPNIAPATKSDSDTRTWLLYILPASPCYSYVLCCSLSSSLPYSSLVHYFALLCSTLLSSTLLWICHRMAWSAESDKSQPSDCLKAGRLYHCQRFRFHQGHGLNHCSANSLGERTWKQVFVFQWRSGTNAWTGCKSHPCLCPQSSFSTCLPFATDTFVGALSFLIAFAYRGAVTLWWTSLWWCEGLVQECFPLRRFTVTFCSGNKPRPSQTAANNNVFFRLLPLHALEKWCQFQLLLDAS